MIYFEGLGPDEHSAENVPRVSWCQLGIIQHVCFFLSCPIKHDGDFRFLSGFVVQPGTVPSGKLT